MPTSEQAKPDHFGMTVKLKGMYTTWKTPVSHTTVHENRSSVFETNEEEDAMRLSEG